MFQFKTTPFKHQADCFELSKDRKFFALLMEMGTGKSKVLLDTAAHLYETGKINALFIVAYKGCYMNWATNEIPTHFVDRIRRKVLVWNASVKGQKEAELKQEIGMAFDGMKIFLMNIEALCFPRSLAFAEAFVQKHRCMMVCDESTSMKHLSSKRTKVAIALGQKAVAKRIMTGSVVDNKPLDAFSQFEFLAPACLGFKSYFAFRAHFAELFDMRAQGRSFKQVKGYRNLDDLRRRIAVHSFIIKKADCLGLPKKTYQTWEVELSEEQLKHYASMRKRLMTEIGEELSSVKIALTKLIRLHQIVCGHLPDDTGVIHPIPHNRIRALMEILEGTTGQVIIWANYRESIFEIKRALVEEYGAQAVLTYFGDTSDEERTTAKRVFFRGADTEGYRFLVANQATGGYGNNFTGANTQIFYSNDFDAEKRNQSEDRCLTEDSLVFCAHNGYISSMSLLKIKELKVGDSVLTHTGSFKKISAVYSKEHRGLFTQISYRGWFEPLTCTHDHKILIKRNGSRMWVPAHTALPTDSLCLPRLSSGDGVIGMEFVYPESWRTYPGRRPGSEICHCGKKVIAKGMCDRHYRESKLNGTTPVDYVSMNGRYVPLPDKVILDKEWLYLFGWFIAEGFVLAKDKGVSFSGHLKERPILERLGRKLNQALGVDYSVHDNLKNNGSEMRVYNKELAVWFRSWFGNGSYDIHLPDYLVESTTPDEASEILRGYVDGDGYMRNQQIEWASVSELLCYQMALLTTKAGFIPTMRKVSRNGEKGKSDYYVGGYTRFGNPCNKRLSDQDTEFVYRPIVSVTTYFDKKRVHDISVEDDHSFVTGLCTVHNCHRIGQTEPVTYIDLVCRGTVDDKILGALKEKKDLSELITPSNWKTFF